MWQEMYMKSVKENPIAVQSKQWILKALLVLMAEKDFSKITVKELAKRADLDRKTFYRNFNSKEEVLYLILEEMCQRYIQMLQELPKLCAYEGTEAYFTLCIEYKDFFMLLKQHNLLPLVLMKFDEYLPALNDIFINDPTYRNKSKYELVYQAGGFWNVTTRWIYDGLKETPAEMAQIIGSIMPSLLKD